MSLDLFMSLLRQCHPGQKNYRPLELHHLGESLLHPEVGRFVEEAGRMDIPTEMSVNPALLSFDIAKRLVDGGIRRIVISLDGMDDETLTAIRGPAALYSKAEPNLDRLLGYVATIKDPPSIVIQMIDLQRNIHQREAFIQRWGHSGLPTVQAYIKDLDGDDPDLGSPSPHPLSFLCTYPWRSVAVLWDGRVVPCCRDADADITLGDLNTQSLYEIWNGAIAQQLREYHRAAEMPADHLCRSCPWFRSNFVLHKPHRHPDLARRDYLRW
jgi:radical SAM protein with 4Fe4S-binding SPASM domain